VDLRERGSGRARHPWEVSRSRFFLDLVADHVDLTAVQTVLDAGAGDGWFAGELLGALDPAASITCWDVNYRSEDLVAPSDPRIVRTATRPSDPYDLVLALDVLEHLDDDETFLAETVVPLLGGTLVVSVPAMPRLFCEHDRMLEHRRRYRRRDLLAMLGRHVDILESGTLFTSLLVPRIVTVAAERVGHESSRTGVGEWSGSPRTTSLIVRALDADAAVGRRLARRGIVLPGLSVWAVCRPRRP
jgi:2-polyprenyl-3-methyl-5-hydroxy-6-metoxy-1,4-benzoquinol methylase